MEAMEINLFQNIYKNTNVLITGHTGFKGSWLSLWLEKVGANVFGVALDPDTVPNHWEIVGLGIEEHRIDIRDFEKLDSIIEQINPTIVFHLAAQPIVRRSYKNPLENWSTNVLGTANILEACRNCNSVKAVVAITTDKVYLNNEWVWGYRETDRLGGHDPYSASKSACEIAIESYRKSFFNSNDSLLLASARAGNVIGGGDWGEDRLIPDVIKSISSDKKVQIRFPQATRPWQHVLDCLSGYLLLGQKLLQRREEFAESWNFGPSHNDNASVENLLILLNKHWSDVRWEIKTDSSLHETSCLFLDSTKAKTALEWKPTWDLETSVSKTAEWYKSYYKHNLVLTNEHIDKYINSASKLKQCWTLSNES